jgi:hypothetical protein
MKTGFGPDLISLRQSSEGTHSIFSSAWLFNIVVLFVKAIARTRFAKCILPPEEVTIVCPPSGDPDADPQEYWLLLRTLYGLRRSPRHRYDKINVIL